MPKTTLGNDVYWYRCNVIVVLYRCFTESCDIKVLLNQGNLSRTRRPCLPVFSPFSRFRPQTLLAGMNKFLSQLEITFRRDPNNFRPRINKMNSIKVSL